MTPETAHAILDWYLPYINDINDVKNPLFIFTGGEPLLQISLIKKITEVIDSKIPHLRPLYRLISNGTLLTGQIAQYLEDHNVDMIISIDGDKSAHDNNRPFANGGSTWETIWDRINLLSLKYRENNLSVSSVYEETLSLKNWDVLLKKLNEHNIFFWTLNINNLTILENPEETAGKIIELRNYAKSKYNIVVSGKWATPAANIRAGNRYNAICSAAGRNRIFFQPDGSVTFCDYDPRKLSSVVKIEDYINLVNENKEQYYFGNWNRCSDCMLAGFCSPCVLEEEVLHCGNSHFQELKCRFIHECTKLLMFE
jgi:sulfatase maturation enzyme AslB (radical SAM superfamily)